ncbi:MAG: histidine kinase [Chloroflexi bacterium]|nr:MAG: histidine kinase [Anaerolineaceae bacterium 4572_32.2]RLC76982.1 MAG: histidine kinase [Chloroflexota bacterium]RLC83221.1 MAG: histidine kinase [Chloroflexota bacterium]HEY73644.1 ATP-binding cassette domain-containing protein [Thermoflexia bacterium]
MEPLLKAVNLSKSFGTLSVVRRTSLAVHQGEVVGLAGQSGSGKSTLAMLLAGFHVPDEGELYFAGRRLQWPFRVRALGIEVIHQTPSLAENLDITSNIFLGNEIGWPVWGKWLKSPNRRRMDREATRILTQLDMRFTSLREAVSNLSSEQRQMIAIACVMTCTPRLIIIDDPTRLLSYPRQQKLLSLIQIWQQQGTAVIFSSDNLDHLLAVTDRIVVLRHGRLVAEYVTDETDRAEIVAAVVGATDRQQLTPIIWALDSYYRVREQAEKLRHHQEVLEQDLTTQGAVDRQFVDQLAKQINALDSANAALQDAQRRLLTELEQERKSLAREIHDQVIQDLLSVNYELEEIGTAEAATPGLDEGLSGIRESIRGLIDDLRRICGSLRPPTIDNLGLGAAIQSYTHDWSKRTAISTTLALDNNLGRFSETIELSIFRIVQEGLSNVRKHSGASNVEISLKHTSPRTLLLSIADNGRGLAKGFELAKLPVEEHYGLLGISERVALLGGRVKFQNQARGGLLIQAEIPHPRITQTSGEQS